MVWCDCFVGLLCLFFGRWRILKWIKQESNWIARSSSDAISQGAG
jgi:hypothetical protein